MDHRTNESLGLPPTAHVCDGLSGAVGNTPLIYLRSLSELTGCIILGKAEFLNPGGSSKDRVARAILDDAEAGGGLRRRRRCQHRVARVRGSSSSYDGGRFKDNEMKGTMDSQKEEEEEGDEEEEEEGEDAVVEGSAGSTAISLALLARARGHGCIVTMVRMGIKRNGCVCVCISSYLG